MRLSDKAASALLTFIVHRFTNENFQKLYTKVMDIGISVLEQHEDARKAGYRGKVTVPIEFKALDTKENTK